MNQPLPISSHRGEAMLHLAERANAILAADPTLTPSRVVNRLHSEGYDCTQASVDEARAFLEEQTAQEAAAESEQSRPQSDEEPTDPVENFTGAKAAQIAGIDPDLFRELLQKPPEGFPVPQKYRRQGNNIRNYYTRADLLKIKDWYQQHKPLAI